MLGAFTTVWALYFVAQGDETINTDLYGKDMDDEVNQTALARSGVMEGFRGRSGGPFWVPAGPLPKPRRVARRRHDKRLT